MHYSLLQTQYYKQVVLRQLQYQDKMVVFNAFIILNMARLFMKQLFPFLTVAVSAKLAVLFSGPNSG